ncbi:MAG TPA: cache domain-containing protein [Herbaspirillum sp.]
MKKNTIWPQIRLAWWITIGVAAIVMVTTLLLLAVVDQFARNYARHEAEVRLKQLAWQMRDALDHTMKQRIVDIKDLSQRGALRNYADPATLRIALNLAKNEFNDYAWIGITDSNGKVVAGTQSALEGRSAAQRPWFIGGKKDLYVGNYQPIIIKQTLPFAVQPLGFIDISTPIFDPKGNYKGVLGAHLSWNWARDIAHDLLDPANQRYNVDILVVRDDGMVLLGPKDLEAKKIKTDSLDLARKGQSGSIVEQWGGSDGKRYITGYVRTGMWTGEAGMNWSILVRQSEHVALADILVLEKQMVIVAIMEALLLAVCAVLLSYKFVAPMNALSKAIESRSPVEDDYVAKGWSYYEFNRLSTAVGAIPKHQFGADSEMFEQRVGDRVHQLRDLIAGLPEMQPGMPTPEHYRNRDLFK